LRRDPIDAQNLREGRYFDALIDAGGIIIDAGAAFVPLLPGGVATAIKATRHGGKVVDESFDVANTFRGDKFREIILKPGTLLVRVFKKGVNRAVGRFTTRGNTAKRLTSTEAAITELGLEGTSNIKPNRITTLEVLETIKAKAGFIEGGGKKAFQIVLDRSDLGKVRRVPRSTRILK